MAKKKVIVKQLSQCDAFQNNKNLIEGKEFFVKNPGSKYFSNTSYIFANEADHEAMLATKDEAYAEDNYLILIDNANDFIAEEL